MLTAVSQGFGKGENSVESWIFFLCLAAQVPLVRGMEHLFHGDGLGAWRELGFFSLSVLKENKFFRGQIFQQGLL